MSDNSDQLKNITLFGGISGAELAVYEYELHPGLIIRRTYAHVMAPYLMAFKKPEQERGHHPAPWKAAKGGIGFDINIEIALEKESSPTNFDRINTIWWVTALLRLISCASIRMPVVSDIQYKAIPNLDVEPNLGTIEMSQHQLKTAKLPPSEISLQNLDWVRTVLLSGAQLMDNEFFNRAFQTYDSARWSHSAGSAILMLWASLETIFRPGRESITKNLSILIASFLYPAGSERDRAFQKIKSLYEERGKAAHDSQTPQSEELFECFSLANRSFVKCFELNTMPDPVELFEKWEKKI